MVRIAAIILIFIALSKAERDKLITEFLQTTKPPFFKKMKYRMFRWKSKCRLIKLFNQEIVIINKRTSVVQIVLTGGQELQVTITP